MIYELSKERPLEHGLNVRDVLLDGRYCTMYIQFKASLNSKGKLEASDFQVVQQFPITDDKLIAVCPSMELAFDVAQSYHKCCVRKLKTVERDTADILGQVLARIT